ncbi:hypothetical protein FJT64_024616 [Amphibalanus amphitrite]|uniref:Follistatin-like domain-containing protein n=1 Tax=Amphibalanus amphitrite TaxID=1232801 RepID=A0A6A4WDW1_AMPAM|nr:hypothetical protein FJT64_024616 [Amphibalanus amphitrite]
MVTGNVWGNCSPPPWPLSLTSDYHSDGRETPATGRSATLPPPADASLSSAYSWDVQPSPRSLPSSPPQERDQESPAARSDNSSSSSAWSSVHESDCECSLQLSALAVGSVGQGARTQVGAGARLPPAQDTRAARDAVATVRYEQIRRLPILRRRYGRRTSGKVSGPLPASFRHLKTPVSFSMSSLQPAGFHTPETAAVRLRADRPYNSLCRKRKERSTADPSHRQSWGSEVSKDSFWEALEPSYAFLMADQLIESCKEASGDLTWDATDVPGMDSTWSYGEFMDQYNELYQWLNEIQVVIYSSPKNITDRRLRESHMEEIQRKSYRRTLLAEQSCRLQRRQPELREEVQWRLAHLTAKWDTLLQCVRPPSPPPAGHTADPDIADIGPAGHTADPDIADIGPDQPRREVAKTAGGLRKEVKETVVKDAVAEDEESSEASLCDQRSCPGNRECRVVRGRAHCLTKRTCARLRCRYDQECVTGEGLVRCVKRRSCDSVSCRGADRECRVLGGLARCVKRLTCADLTCGFGETCATTNGTAACVPSVACHDLTCPDDQECRIVGGEGAAPSCVKRQDCEHVRCAPGHTCHLFAGAAKCVTTTTCADTTCRYDHVCRVRNDLAGCIPRAGAKCGGTVCKPGYECIQEPNGESHCSSELSCVGVQCLSGQQCVKEHGVPRCRASCEGLQCGPRAHCEVKLDQGVCVECDLPCPRGQVCRLIDPNVISDLFVAAPPEPTYIAHEVRCLEQWFHHMDGQLGPISFRLDLRSTQEATDKLKQYQRE